MFEMIWVMVFMTAAGPAGVELKFGPFETKEACEKWNAVEVQGRTEGMQLIASEAGCVAIEKAPEPGAKSL